MPTHFPESMLVANADRRACRALLANGSRSFFAASHLLPRRVRDPATALYAFCRLADDAVDLETAEPYDRHLALERLRERLDGVYRGAPIPRPADRAFAEVVRHFAIPSTIPAALLEGLAWDAEGRRYATLADLQSYAARVAGTVGVMMALIMGVRDRAALARACDLGAAMQLTNIARDVGEDARNGRLYIPLDWLRAEGVDPDTWLATPHFTPAIGRLTRRLLEEARHLYAQAELGIAALPMSCRPGIRAARLLYAKIGDAVAENAYDSVNQRARVSGSRKLRLLIAAMVPRRRQAASAAPLPEARFLVEAVEPRVSAVAKPSLTEQVLWVLDLFERIERRQVEGRP